MYNKLNKGFAEVLMKKRASIALIPSALVIIAGAVLLFLADEKLASYILLGVGTLAAVLAFVTVET